FALQTLTLGLLARLPRCLFGNTRPFLLLLKRALLHQCLLPSLFGLTACFGQALFLGLARQFGLTGNFSLKIADQLAQAALIGRQKACLATLCLQIVLNALQYALALGRLFLELCLALRRLVHQFGQLIFFISSTLMQSI